MWRRGALAVLVGSMLLGAVTVPAAADGRDRDRSHRDKPSRVLIIMLDQARPDTIERYDMDNVKELMRRGTSFPNALVGHMAAETVISHSVITSSQFPKNMGWSNEVHRDVEGVLGPPGDYYVTSSLSCNQFKALIEHGGYKKLPDYLDDRFGSASKFVSIAQKRTAVCPAGPTSSVADGDPTDPEDIIFQIRGSSGAPCDPAYGASSWREPEYANGTPPLYLGLFPCSRWSTWQGAGAYGTGSILPGRIYPLEGDRFVPGRHPLHVGGDNWSADAVIRVIENDPAWRGMLVSLGGIDKLGHMWGPEDEETGPPGSDQEMRHLPFIAKNADVQVGRMVDALRRKRLLDDTLIVVTADHAAQTGRDFHGVFEGFPPPNGNGCNPATGSTGLRSDCNWYFGRDADEVYLDPSPAIAGFRDALTPLGGETNLDFSYQDGHVAAWLDDNSRQMKRHAADAALDLPGVIASYYLDDDQDDYRLFDTNRMSRSERRWFERHGGRLVDTMAAPYGPDVTALLETDVTYGVMGDHGGHNRLIQNIPMIFHGPGVGSRDSDKEIRLVDVMPTILDTMGIRYDKRDVDGRAVELSRRDRD
jgi:Type I phosphodiesterase / nucleotide pyrophosphatase